MIACLLATWEALNFIGFAFATALAVRQRRVCAALACVVGLLLALFLSNLLIQRPACLPLPLAFALALLLSILCVFMHANTKRYRLTHITPDSIKEAADELPTGFCYYREDGSIFMANRTMNRIVLALTGHSFLNGRDLERAVGARTVIELALKEEVKVYRLVRNDLAVEGEPVTEVLAEDVTDLHQRAAMLKAANEQLHRKSEYLKQYGASIDETVRHEEILNAKVAIHDELNRLLLATDKAIASGAPEQRQAVLDSWRKNVLLLCSQADQDKGKDALGDLEELAQLIGVRLVFNAKPAACGLEVLRLFVLTTAEALANAAKHAQARTLFVEVREDDEELVATFTNDGCVPATGVVESGGLANLRRKIEDAHGIMTVTAQPAYSLTVQIPKG